MTRAADTLPAMDGTRGEPPASRYDELHAEATEALGFAANTLRAIRDRYRAAYLDELERWEAPRDDLARLEHTGTPAPTQLGRTASRRRRPASSRGSAAAAAAEAGAADLRLRMLRGEVDGPAATSRRHETELSRLELAIRNLESTWLFLERGDASLIGNEDLPTIPTELQMRIVEAQEAERVRLAQEVHDGPAQALSNAIFQVEFIDRVFESDPGMARAELGFLRELLRRELGDVRSFIGPAAPARPRGARPRRVDRGHGDHAGGAVGPAHHDRARGADGRPGRGRADGGAARGAGSAAECPQARGATNVVVATVLDDGQWVLEVRDDGRGFDTGAVAARGRRNFGLQFMRERAELVGAQFEVRSRPEAGTVVRLAIPLTRKENG